MDWIDWIDGEIGWSAAYVPSLYLLMLPTDLPATINAVSSRVQHHPYGSIVLASRATNCSEVRQSAGLRSPTQLCLLQRLQSAACLMRAGDPAGTDYLI